MTLRIYKEMAAKINVTTRYPLEKKLWAIQSITKRIGINSSYLIQCTIDLIQLVDWGYLRPEKCQIIKLIQNLTLT